MNSPEPAAVTSPKNTRALPLHDEVARQAEQLWIQNGRPSGRDEEFWLKAELEVLGADSSIRIEGAGAVSANQYKESTDANAAKRKSGSKR